MKIVVVAYYTAIRFFRNILAVCAFIAAPILLVYFMGALTGNSAPDTSVREKVAFYSEDAGSTSVQFDKLLRSPGVSRMVEITDVPSMDDGIGKVKNGDIDAFVFIGQDFSKDVESGKRAEITLYEVNRTSAAMTIANSFADSVNGTAAVIRLGKMPSANAASENMSVQEIDLKGMTASTKDMASVACLLIFIFYGALLGSDSVISELKKKTFIRLKCAPVTPFGNFAGKLLGNVAFMFVCTVIDCLAASLIFHLNLNGNILPMLAALAIFLVIVNSLGILLAGITKNIYLCGLLTFALNYFFVYPVTANAFAPGTNTIYDISRFISPQYYTYHAVMGSIYRNMTSPAGALAVLSLMALLLCSASWLVVKKQAYR